MPTCKFTLNKKKELRDEQNLRLCDLSDMTGLSEATLNGFENGQRTLSFENIQILAASFGVTVDTLCPNPFTVKQRQLR